MVSWKRARGETATYAFAHAEAVPCCGGSTGMLCVGGVVGGSGSSGGGGSGGSGGVGRSGIEQVLQQLGGDGLLPIVVDPAPPR